MFRPCIIIPCYNHGSTMPSLVKAIEEQGFPCIIVDDGSEQETLLILSRLAEQSPALTLLRHETNQGKGAAVLTGLSSAKEQGFSHALQIDADGQHDPTDIPVFLKEAQSSPRHVVSGRPVYDDSIPKIRFYGRYITHALVWLETLSFEIPDSMCGFRVYPIQEALAVLRREGVGSRMDFDTEALVRLYRKDMPVTFLPTQIVYPLHGVSHFRLFKDNLRISAMHTRLLFGLPAYGLRWLRGKERWKSHWSSTAERGSLLGLFLTLWIYRHLGRRVFNLLLYPVIAYFWVTGVKARHASQGYLRRLGDTARRTHRTLPPGLNSFRHFFRFGEAVLDKLAAWSGTRHLDELNIEPKELYRNILDRKEGLVVIGSHLGDLESSRALAEQAQVVPLNALVFTGQAQRFYRALQSINPQSSVNLIQVDKLGPDTVVRLQDRIRAGEWVIIMGDRTPVSEDGRIVWADFLGERAPFPQGPFILASLLECPVYLMFALKEPEGMTLRIEYFSDRLRLPRKEREQALREAAQKFANRLEAACFRAPLDWFNFFDFWDGKLHSQKRKNIS